MGVKISELNSVEDLQNEDVFPVVQDGETKKVSKEQLLGQMEQQTETNTEDISNLQQEQETQNTQISKNEEDIEELQITKADRTEIPTNLNQLSNADTKFVNETQLANAVQQETTARQQQDVELQNQIDAITSQSDVVDVVGTYAELMDYDTSTITENDIIKVLQDSTHENATSYFRWSDNSWGYVGSEGPYYTKGETDERLNLKANQTSLDTTNQNLNTLAGRVGTNETDISGIKAEQTTQNRQIATLIADSGNKIELSVNSQTYILTATLKNKAGETLNTSQIDLPLEAMIVNAEYDSTTKELVLTLQNGNTLRVSLADIVSGLVSQDDFDDLEVRVDDLEDDVADIKEEQTTQNAEIEELQERVEILETTVNSELEDATATGESISVTDSANAPAKLLPSGRTEQEQTNGYQLIPTPNEFSSYTTNGVAFESYPDGTYKVYGTSTGVVNAYLNINTGKFTSTNNVNQSSLEAGEYTYHASIAKGSVGNLKARAGTTDLTLYGNDRTFTLENDISNFNLYWRIASEGTTVDNEFKIMLEKGSVIHDWERYTGGQPSPNSEYPQQIHVVKGENTIAARTVENLLRPEYFYPISANGYNSIKELIESNDDLYMFSGNPGNQLSYNIVFPCKPSTDYVFKVDQIIGYDAQDNIISDSIGWNSSNSKPFKTYEFADITFQSQTYTKYVSSRANALQYTSENGKYIKFKTDADQTQCCLNFQGNVANKIKMIKPLLYEGENVNIPYYSKSFTLTLPEGMEMCKIGNYTDTFEKQNGKWYKNEIIGDYLFDGNENIQKTGDVFYTDDIGDNILSSGIICLSNRMKGVTNTNTGSTLLTDTCCFRINSYSRFYFNMSSITTDIDTIKQYLAENETHVKYIRNAIKPIEITDQTLISQLDAMQKVLSYYGGTNITTITAGDLKPILNFDYKKSSNLRIKALENAVFNN